MSSTRWEASMRGFGLAATAALALVATAPMHAQAAGDDRAAGTEIVQRDSQDLVRLAQRALQAGGYYLGEVDGVFGLETLDAVKHYQQSNRMPVTGRLDYHTLAELTAAMPGTTY